MTNTWASGRMGEWALGRVGFAAMVMGLAACSSNPSPTVDPRPVPLPPSGARPATTASLPAIPAVDGPLVIDVVYPREGVTMAVRDSTFIFGNVGTGRAEARINGARVTVESNGAFLAFLPVPLDGVYRVEATRDGQTVRAERRVNVPLAETPRSGVRATILASSLSPRGALAVRRDELLDVAFRGTAGGQATLVLPSGRRINLVEDRREGSTLSTYRAVISPEPFMTRDTAIRRPRVGSSEIELENQLAAAAGAAARGETERAPSQDRGGAYFELLVGTDTVRVPVPANLSVIDPMRPAVGVASDPNPVGGSNDGYVVGRPAPGTVSHYFWPNGTELT